MYIKQIIIQGFKSYKDQTVIEPFSPKHNVVVGRNGSGKSNFFWAIRFVLGDAYTTMTREERQSLLHEGSGPATISAYVEIIFDNSDNRFPTGKDEVVLRRTIGLKKDEYSLDRKSVTKSDIMSLLEAAGFSRANPYYIVPQGRITSLCNARDSDRLALLKEVAGTRVYEERRQESLKIMEDTETKRQKIDELIQYIDERLEELEEEKAELREYQEQERDRRCLEYTIYQRELDIINAEIEQLEEDRQTHLNESDRAQSQLTVRDRRLAEIERTQKQYEQQREMLSVERTGLMRDHGDAVKTSARLEARIRDLEETLESGNEARKSATKELHQLRDLITAKQDELEKLVPEFNKVCEEEQDLKKRISEAEVERQTLYAKQGRASQFKSRAERDAWLKSEIKNLNKLVNETTTSKKELENDHAKAQERVRVIEAALESHQQQSNAAHVALQDAESRMMSARQERERIEERKKELWRDEAKFSTQRDQYAEELTKWERALRSTMDRNTSRALPNIERIVRRYQLNGVYGPLYELFDCDEKYRSAVETVAGNSLFHVVVDTDATATRLLDLMNRERDCGRVTMMPLNRLRPRETTYPTANDAIPMIRKLRFDPKFEPAFKQVFGKAIICPDLTTASQYARSLGLSAVTLDGDRADRKGALSGGYVDHRRSRLECAFRVQEWKNKLVEADRTWDNLREETAKIDQQALALKDEVVKLEDVLRKCNDKKMFIFMDHKSKTRESASLKEAMVNQESSIRGLETELSRLSARLAAYQQELGTELKSDLSASESRRLDELNKSLDTTKRRVIELSGRRAQIQAKKEIIENELKENLEPRRQALTSRLDSLGFSSNDGTDNDGDSAMNSKLQSLRQEKETAVKKTQSLARRLKEVEENLEELNAQILETSAELERVRTEQIQDQRSVQKQQQHLEKYLTRKHVLQRRKEDVTRNVRDLGVLPEEAFEKFKNVSSSKKLEGMLHKVNEALKKFSHVNKKAFEQYNNFTKQRDELLTRREELNKSYDAIEKLITVLDQRKDEAIQGTFSQVSSNFEQVYAKLVPAGQGRLIMQRRVEEETTAEEETTQTDASSSASTPRKRKRNHKETVEQYTGIAIKVSFNSKTDEGLLMQQLSGGQKSLVALALIFAIQMCDPAPFYLFDEVDANLDPAYRASVAAMIHELSQNAQFITTTFRPELCANANKFYGVTFTNKVSHIQVITQQDAINFVDHETTVQ